MKKVTMAMRFSSCFSSRLKDCSMAGELATFKNHRLHLRYRQPILKSVAAKINLLFIFYSQMC